MNLIIIVITIAYEKHMQKEIIVYLVQKIYLFQWEEELQDTTLCWENLDTMEKGNTLTHSLWYNKTLLDTK